jgi:t-SNARE complex subunit (syntaxin)
VTSPHAGGAPRAALDDVNSARKHVERKQIEQTVHDLDALMSDVAQRVRLLDQSQNAVAAGSRGSVACCPS